MKKIIRRGAAATLAAVTLVTSAAVPVRAAAPRVQVDETMYVNLDYYGTATQINVVKGCTTNGLTEYTDYGTYDKVVNMTDDTAPEIGDGTVTWKLPEKNSRFYYQCTMPKNSVDLPWTFDVSYKLNGVEADASKLAGASGLVEVNVKATPNEKAKAYYKNNMVLTVLVPVDMEKCYSVDAPGAQVQSVGSYQAAMFAALPGEDGDFTVRVGTDNYENIGVIMMMVPGTLDELNRIKDLKEAKDTWREDGNKMYDSMNALLKTIEEPPAYAVILLLTENAEILLPTIRSRCVMLKLRNIKDQLIKKYLMEQMEIPDYKADVCVAFAQGNMGRAIMLATSEHFNEIKEEAVHLLREINDMDVDALEAAVKRVVSYKMNITDYLDVISVWYRDVLIYKATKNVDQVVFSDQLRFIKDRASKSSYEGIENILDGIEKAKARLKANVNFELTMELLLLTIKEN